MTENEQTKKDTPKPTKPKKDTKFNNLSNALKKNMQRRKNVKQVKEKSLLHDNI